MFFKRNVIFCGILAIFLQNTSCGVLGEREDLNRILVFGAKYVGCLNQLGPKVKRYFHGEIEEREWIEAWDCTIESLKLFRTYVRGSHLSGFTPEDLHAYSSKILVTEKPFSIELIKILFDLKASVMGGDNISLSQQEVDHIIEFISRLKTESTKMIPHIQNIFKSPNSSQLLQFIEIASHSAEALGSAISFQNQKPFFLNHLETLLAEMAHQFDWDIPIGMSKAVILAKTLLTGGAENEIKGSYWPPFIHSMGALAAMALAIRYGEQDNMPSPNEYGNFITKIFKDFSLVLERSFNVHGGMITYSLINRFIESIPVEYLTVSKGSLIRSLPIINARILSERNKEGITDQWLVSAQRLLDQWALGQYHIENLFQTMELDPSGVEIDRFIVACHDYLKLNLDSQSQTEIRRILNLAVDYRPFYGTSGKEITVGAQSLRTRYGISQYHWLEMASQIITKGYSNPVSEAQFHLLFTEFSELFYEFKFFNPYRPGVEEKRFRESDIFTMVSNGDGFMDQNEGVYFLSAVLSIGEGANKFKKLMNETCAISQGLKDDMGWNWMDPDCFHKLFSENRNALISNLPQLAAYFNHLKPKSLDQVLRTIENNAKEQGDPRAPLGSAELQVMLGLMHYVEMVFLRYDLDHNGKIDTDEALRAFPTFRQTISKFSGIRNSNRSTLEAIFTYLVHYGEPPENSLGGKIGFLWWKTRKDWWDIKADRADIFKLTSFFNRSSANSLSYLQDID